MTEPQPMPKPDDELKQFLLVFRQSLLMVVRYIERTYDIVPRDERREDKRKDAA